MHIGRTYSGPRRNWTDLCDYCGVEYHRNELKMDPNGYLACPDDVAGRTERELDEIQAANSSEPSTVRGKTREY